MTVTAVAVVVVVVVLHVQEHAKMKITKRQLKRIIREEKARLVNESSTPGYSPQAIADRIIDAASSVIEDYIDWHASQGRLSSVMNLIETDAAQVATLVKKEIEVQILALADMYSESQDREW